MTTDLSRMLLLLASRWLGEHRRAWALAMEAEFAIARADGHGLRFAAGCLIAALRAAPAHTEGRLRLARQATAAGLLVPIAAVLASAAGSGFAYPGFAHAGLFSAGLADGRDAMFVNGANSAAAAVLAPLLALIAACHAAVGWATLDRD